MTPRPRLYINGRFLSQRTTGVQRAAADLVLAIDGLVADGGSGAWFDEAVLLHPPFPGAPPPFRAIRTQELRGATGHAWEQLVLPGAVADGVLLNFCNTAPLTVRRQVAWMHDASVFAVPGAYSWQFRAWYGLMLRVVARRANGLVTSSSFSRRELARFLGVPPSRFSVIPLATHAPAIGMLPGTYLAAIGQRRPYFLTVASNSPHKNLGVVAPALDATCREDYDVVVVGGANSRVFATPSALEHGRLRRLGYVSDEELRALYAGATGLLLPTLYEGFGLPALEAMAAGCPVIAGRVASLPEVCGEAAVWVDPSSPTSLAAAMDQLIADPALRRHLIAAGLAQAATFSWTASAVQLMAKAEQSQRFLATGDS